MKQKSKYILDNYEALGTIWFIEVFGVDGLILDQIDKKVIRIINSFEDDYSRFKSSSSLNILNSNRFIKSPSREFRELIELGLKFHKYTDGVFDFGIANTLSEYGYGEVMNFNQEVESSVLQDSIVITDDEISLKNNITLDFGGFGKGYLVDKVARYLKDDCFITDFLINAGGDIFVTSGNGNPVEIFLNDPRDEGRLIAKIDLKNSALCSSSTNKRTWSNTNNEKFNHILDSSNKYSPIQSSYAFVASNTCCIADMLSTTLCIKSDALYIEKLKENFEFEFLDI